MPVKPTAQSREQSPVRRQRAFLFAAFAMIFAAPVMAEDTGDRLGGVPVIGALTVESLVPGRHDFYFRAGWRNSGQALHVPVVVVKGARPGKRLLLTAAVHGDELNGIGVIHRLLEGIDAQSLSGTLIAVPGVNQPGINANNRRYMASGGGGYMVDPNRDFPGTDQLGGSTVRRFLGALWHGLFKDNTDLAVDLHTQTRGTAYPLFVFADFKNGTAKEAAFLLGPDMIKNDHGQKGTLETTLMEAGIPAVTFEVGSPKVFQQGLITRAVGGIRNLMRRHSMIAGDSMPPPVAPIVGSSYTNVYTETGGIAVLHVALKDAVTRGQHVATLYDPFGREIKRYVAPHDGWVLAVSTDPMKEAGAMLVRILQ
jgi:predicted deacylase